MRLLVPFFLLFIHTLSFASVELKFISYINPTTGEIAPMMPAFPLEKRFHIAIKINDFWYHMLPQKGFIKSKSFNISDPTSFMLEGRKYNLYVETLTNKQLDLPDIDVSLYQGVRFDIASAWDDPTSSHCSKFVGKLLDLKPTKVRHNIRASGSAQVITHNLSPDDIFELIRKKAGWEYSYSFRAHSCSQTI